MERKGETRERHSKKGGNKKKDAPREKKRMEKRGKTRKRRGQRGERREESGRGFFFLAGFVRRTSTKGKILDFPDQKMKNQIGN